MSGVAEYIWFRGGKVHLRSFGGEATLCGVNDLRQVHARSPHRPSRAMLCKRCLKAEASR